MLSATSPRAPKVEIRTMSLEGGIVRMRPLAGGVESSAGSDAVLPTGGHHLMLIELIAGFCAWVEALARLCMA
ncbi:copper chaperone PCu(A)C [Sphingomonas sanguinis]|uniref:copper chaperone PCu(A)C n=1 Tax=Sphingomonas sanguinis TaxID=33051 RepID=UPI0009EE25B1